MRVIVHVAAADADRIDRDLDVARTHFQRQVDVAEGEASLFFQDQCAHCVLLQALRLNREFRKPLRMPRNISGGRDKTITEALRIPQGRVESELGQLRGDDRQGSRVGGRQHQRDQELVPDQHEGEDDGADERLRRHRQGDAEEDGVGAVAVDERRLLDLARDLAEGGDREPDRDREREQRVGDDHRGAGVVEPEVEPDHHQRQGDRDRRQEAQRQDEELDVGRAARGIARHRIGAGQAEHGADQNRRRRNDDRVDQRAADAGAIEHVGEIVERRLEHHGRRRRLDVDRMLEGAEQRPQHRNDDNAPRRRR